MAHLVFRDARRELFHYRLSAGRVLVGRSDACDISLPGDTISRVHCHLEFRDDTWWLVDRSRHGTPVNHHPVERRHPLMDGDTVSVGDFDITYHAQTPPSTTPLTTMQTSNSTWDEVVEADGEALVSNVGQLVFIRGPHEGRIVALRARRTSLGGEGSRLKLDDSLPPKACYVRMVRGRPLIEPGKATVYLAGLKVREVTPVLPGEEVRLGEHGFRMETHTERLVPDEAEGFGQLVGQSHEMRRLFAVLGKIAAHDAPTLISGPSGSGKELAARGLHDSGPRNDGPFIALNCGGIPQELMESELFGHEKGAFTGADRRTEGAFQRAAGGTLFLDEVAELPIDTQATLLRVLESGEVRRVGGNEVDFPDVRLVAATHQDLPGLIDKGKFRQDLYFRLAVITVRLPPLRERREDIPLLARTLLSRHHPGTSIDEAALAQLKAYDWPGNVRELRNVLTRAVVMGGPQVTTAALTFNPWAFDDLPPDIETADELQAPERAMLRDALNAAGGNRSRAARDLGMPRSSLLYKLRKHGLD